MAEEIDGSKKPEIRIYDPIAEIYLTPDEWAETGLKLVASCENPVSIFEGNYKKKWQQIRKVINRGLNKKPSPKQVIESQKRYMLLYQRLYREKSRPGRKKNTGRFQNREEFIRMVKINIQGRMLNQQGLALRMGITTRQLQRYQRDYEFRSFQDLLRECSKN